MEAQGLSFVLAYDGCRFQNRSVLIICGAGYIVKLNLTNGVLSSLASKCLVVAENVVCKLQMRRSAELACAIEAVKKVVFPKIGQCPGVKSVAIREVLKNGPLDEGEEPLCDWTPAPTQSRWAIAT